MAKCDFCSAPDPGWVYSAESFTVAELAWGSSGAWTACDDCSDLIERRLNARLVKRMLATSLAGAVASVPIPGFRLTKREQREAEDHCWKVFNRFLQTRRGERRLFG